MNDDFMANIPFDEKDRMSKRKIAMRIITERS